MEEVLAISFDDSFLLSIPKKLGIPMSQIKGECMSNNQSIIAGIVSFNPEINRLANNISAIALQVERVIVIDNGSKNVKKIKELVEHFPNVELKELSLNKGIAYALNLIGDYAVQNNSNYFITLDQDTIVAENMVDKFKDYLDYENVGIICPYVDLNHDFIPNNSISEVKTAISSGCLNSTKVWQAIGGFWEYLFIDEVDHEYCYQVRRIGKRILRVNNTAINHILGNPLEKKFLGHIFHPKPFCFSQILYR